MKKSCLGALCAALTGFSDICFASEDLASGRTNTGDCPAQAQAKAAAEAEARRRVEEEARKMAARAKAAQVATSAFQFLTPCAFTVPKAE